MIDLYFCTSPNVYKVCIMLEEIGAEYRSIAVDVRTLAQFDPAKIGGGPSSKLPVIVDHAAADGAAQTVFESGAILQYLAEKSGQLLPEEPRKRSEAFQWLFWQMAGLGPFSGQCFHFRAVAPAIAPEVENNYSHSRYEKIMAAHWRVMENRLRDRAFLADDYSIADIACYPWIRYLCPLDGREAYPAIQRWYDTVTARPAVKRAYDRAGTIDMGVPRNAIGTVVYPPETLKSVIVT